MAERSVEQLVPIERRAGRDAQLVEGHELGDPLLERDVRVGGPRVGPVGQDLLGPQVAVTAIAAVPPYRTSPAGSTVARMTAISCQYGPRASR